MRRQTRTLLTVQGVRAGAAAVGAMLPSVSWRRVADRIRNGEVQRGRPRRSAGWVLCRSLSVSAGMLVAAASAACGDAASSSDLSPPALGAMATVTPSTPAPTEVPTPTSVLTDCRAGTVAGADLVTGLGATTSAWAQHHQADPERAGAYLPVMQDGLDRYVQLQCSASGRVAAYLVTYIPGISVIQMHAAVAAELPGDARRISDTTLGGASGCEIVRYVSPTLARVLDANDPRGEVDAEITLTSNPENINQVSLTIPVAAQSPTPAPTVC